MSSDKHILLTIDVEDWFQVENFKPWIPFSSWDERELRVEKNVHRLLNLFDSIELKAHSSKLIEANDSTNSNTPIYPDNGTNQSDIEDFRRRRIVLDHFHYEKSHPKATFFVLGWIAEKLPHLVREIHSRGHKVASHGCNHQLPEQLSADEFKQDLTDSKKLLEDITGAEVIGYRAPSFAVNQDVLKIIEDCGYRYDSSYNSFSLHGRYGKISLNGSGRKGIAHGINDNFHELPISNLQLGVLTLPLGGGGYFRLFPETIYNLGVKKIIKQQNAYLFYSHPWEFDPNQPRVEYATYNYKFRHYVNIQKTRDKLLNLINYFSRCRFITCNQYLSIRNLS